LTQLYAAAAVAVLVGLAIAVERSRAWHGRRAALGEGRAGARAKPYVLYFTGANCTICRTHQEPALSRLQGVEVDKVDAVERSDLAERFHVYTVPTTVVIGTDGRAAAVNYGYAPAEKLRRQLELAS
jgi:hypothetical protein